MSDLAATNCGCDNGCGEARNGGFFGGGNCSCIIWILLLSCLFNNGQHCGCNSGCGGGFGDNSCMILLLLLCCCGGGWGC